MTTLARAALLALSLSAVALAQDETPLFGGLRHETDSIWGLSGRMLTGDLDGDGLHDLLINEIFDDQVTPALGLPGGGFQTVQGPQLPVAPYALALGDVDGDGLPDVVAAQDTHYALMLNLGAGQLDAPLSVAPGDAGAAALGDLNGDGWADLVALRPSIDRVTTNLSDGAGDFTLLATRVVSANSNGVALADFDLDGDLDLAVTADDAVVDLRFLPGNGNGGFFGTVNSTVAGDLSQPLVADFDGDGVPDLMAIHDPLGPTEPEVTQLLGQGDGTFVASVVDHAVSTGGPKTVAGDLDRDGADDLVAWWTASNGTRVLRGGPGGLTPPTGPGWFPGNTSAVGLLDADGDGLLDLLCNGTPSHVGDVDVFRGRGDGSFVHPVATGPGHARLPMPADFDGDGDLDVWATDGSQWVYAWENDGGGVFSPLGELPGVKFRYGVAADMDLDGLPDLVGYPFASAVEVHLGTGDGQVVLASTTPTSGVPDTLEVLDVDGGAPDVAVLVADAFDGVVEVYHGNGDGTLSPTPVVSVADEQAFDMDFADLDFDGEVDVVVSAGGFQQRRLMLMQGQGDGSFVFYDQAGTQFASEPLQVMLGDVDGDGWIDAVAVGAEGSSSGTVIGYLMEGEPGGTMLGGAGGFSLVGDDDPDVGDEGSELVDIDGDGHLDLVIAAPDDDAIEIWRGDGTLDFTQVERFRAGGDILRVVDLDGDGLLDVLCGTQVFLQQRGDAWVGLGKGLGFDLADIHGEPTLHATGSLVAGEPVTLSIANGPSHGLAWLVFGFADASLPFKGGTLVPDPSPPAGVTPVPLDASGALTFGFSWPAGAPGGFETYWQAWMPEPAAPLAWLATNALVGRTP